MSTCLLHDSEVSTLIDPREHTVLVVSLFGGCRIRSMQVKQSVPTMALIQTPADDLPSHPPLICEDENARDKVHVGRYSTISGVDRPLQLRTIVGDPTQTYSAYSQCKHSTLGCI